MNFNNILIEHHGKTAQITINRPEKLNALNKATIHELHEGLKTLNEDAAVRAVLLTGSGTKAFVAGADISEFADFDVSQGSELAAKGQELLFDFIEKMSKPVIALINGFALGGGLELAMSCHMRIASDNAKMGLPEVSLGLIPGYGGTQRLAQLVGRGKALEMICTAGTITASESHSLGLVNSVCAQEELLAKGLELSEKVIKNSPQAIAVAIQAVNAGFGQQMDGLKTEIQLFGECFGTHDFNEGTQAFLNKRKPNF